MIVGPIEIWLTLATILFYIVAGLILREPKQGHVYLPPAMDGGMVVIHNDSASPITIHPPEGDTILTAGESRRFEL